MVKILDQRNKEQLLRRIEKKQARRQKLETRMADMRSKIARLQTKVDRLDTESTKMTATGDDRRAIQLLERHGATKVGHIRGTYALKKDGKWYVPTYKTAEDIDTDTCVLDPLVEGF